MSVWRKEYTENKSKDQRQGYVGEEVKKKNTYFWIGDTFSWIGERVGYFYENETPNPPPFTSYTPLLPSDICECTLV